MSANNGTEFGTAVSGLIGTLLLVAVVYLLTVAQFSRPTAPPAPEEIAKRVAPIGNVTLAGSEGAAPAAAEPAATGAGEEGPGAAIYQKACFACHLSGAAGAPKLDDRAAWEPRVALGIDHLLQTAITGKGGMPPRGTCVDCSDEDLRAAIEYMLAEAGFETESSAGASEAPAAEPPPEAEVPASEETSPAGGISGMEGMSGMEGISGMEGMSGMGEMSDITGGIPVPAAPAMEGMAGMSGAYQTAPDGSVFLFPSEMGGMSGQQAAPGAGSAPTE